MSRFSSLLRGAIGLGALAGMAACADADRKLLLPNKPAGGDLLSSYVALGNSITAGIQSGGINDSTQRQSYAFLFAQQAGTRFAYPSFVKTISVPAGSTTLSITTGCPPLLGNWATYKTTDSLLPPASRPACALRDVTKATDVLNNVGVPFSYASDLLVSGTGLAFPQAPQLFILGGLSQVERALLADPTFVSIWVGNNETLLPASVGILTGYQPPSGGPPIPAVPTGDAFKTTYNAAIDSLVRAARPGLKGILFGATKVTNTPRFFAADSLVGTGSAAVARRNAIGTFTGKGAPAITGCGVPGVTTGWLVSIQYILAIRDGSFPANNIICNPAAAGSKGGGDIFILSPTEIADLNAATDAYNVTIEAKAVELGWAYLDPNPILEGQKTGTSPAIPAVPNFTSNTRDQANSVFGSLFSLDGAHPSAAGQKIIANAMIDKVNEKYGLKIPRVP